MFHIQNGRNIRRKKYTLDLISLDNIDLMREWVAEESGLLNEDDMNWDSLIHEQLALVNVEDDDDAITVDDDDNNGHAEKFSNKNDKKKRDNQRTNKF